MPELTQLERTLRILQRLITHDNVTVNELYDLFDRQEPKRTIQRTLDSIQASHIPLQFTTGPHGERHYNIHRAFDFIPIGLSPDEILAAILLAQFGDLFQGTRIGRDIEGVFEKIDQLMPKNSIAITSALQGITDVLHIHQPGMVEIGSRDQIISDLFRAIIEKRNCWIEYKRGKEAKKNAFEFHPYSLLFHVGAIYCIGFQPFHKNWIYLALQRIRTVSLTDERFERDIEYNLKEFLKDNFGIWHEEPVDVVIRFDREIAHSIQERTWHHSQKIKSLKNGDVELSMHVGPSAELVAWILRWGTLAEVLEPEALRDEIRKVFTEGAALYK